MVLRAENEKLRDELKQKPEIPIKQEQGLHSHKISSLKNELNYIRASAAEKYDQLEKKHQDSQYNI